MSTATSAVRPIEDGDAESGGDDVTVALTSRQVRAGGAASTLIERRHEAVIGRRAVT